MHVHSTDYGRLLGDRGVTTLCNLNDSHRRIPHNGHNGKFKIPFLDHDTIVEGSRVGTRSVLVDALIVIAFRKGLLFPDGAIFYYSLYNNIRQSRRGCVLAFYRQNYLLL